MDSEPSSTSRRQAGQARDAVTGVRRFILASLLILLCGACDQSTKWLAQTHLPRHAPISFAGDLVRLQYAENPGAFLSLGASLPERWRFVIFTGGVALVLAVLTVYLLFFASLRPVPLIALSLVSGGGLSNLYDRIVYGGHVIDFLNVGIGPLRTGIFNVADMAIMAGTLLFLFSSRGRPQQSR